jgi:hypothetical protein
MKFFLIQNDVLKPIYKFIKKKKIDYLDNFMGLLTQLSVGEFTKE